jgi:hypothetical protein
MKTFFAALCVLGPTLLFVALSSSKKAKKYCSRSGGCCTGLCKSTKKDKQL